MKKARILIADRDAQYAAWLGHHIGVFLPDALVSAADFARFERDCGTLTERDCDLLLLGACFGAIPEDPQAEGLELLRRMHAGGLAPTVIALAEEGNELTAVRALYLGAFDYLPKRLLTPQRLNTAVQVALRHIQNRNVRTLRDVRAADAKPPAASRADSSTEPGNELRSLIPGYTVHHVIGESDKAVVYLATSARLQRDVALKVSKHERNDTGERLPLAREYEAVATLRNPAVVEIYDYGVHEDHEYLAMEYFPRGDLKARLKRGLAEHEALQILENIAHALRVLHHAGVLHSDLKPQNVMLRENDDVVLIDFGLARKAQTGLQTTQVGTLRGSPYYMSPEQAQGELLDVRTDLYSLGIIFYEMLTGQKPYTGESVMEVLEQHAEAAVPRLPPALASYQPLLSRLLAKSRDDRFDSAEALLAALQSLRARRSDAA